MIDRKIRVYTDAEKQFILNHHEKLTRRQIADRLNVNINYLHSWMIDIVGRKHEYSPKKRKAKVFVNNTKFFMHDPTISTI